MHYRKLLLPTLVIVLGALGASGRLNPSAACHDSLVHPLVGGWLIETGIDSDASPATLVLFGADGTFFRSNALDGIGVGTWVATGARSATLTIVAERIDGDRILTLKTRATITVDDDGDTLTSDYTIEIVTPSSVGSGEYGPGRAQGRRIIAETPGNPSEPISKLMDIINAGTAKSPSP
jgi:hypothetical protein